MLITVLFVSVILIGLLVGHYAEHREWVARREYLKSRLRKYRKSRIR